MRIYRFLCAILMISWVACSQPSQYIPDPAKVLAQELTNRRVLMVADFSHEFALPYQSIVNILSEWIELARDPSFGSRNLTLFLEEDDQIASTVREYVETGRLDHFLDYALPSTSLERLEFYAHLRRCAQHIDSLNLFLPPPKRITFDIQGPEPVNIFDPTVLDSSMQAGVSYFINGRDSLTASRAITYLKAHPSHRALFFYGAAHLIKTTVAKNVGGAVPANQSLGNYLAFYLKKEFGDYEVLSVNQLSRTRMSASLSGAPAGTLLVKSQNVPWDTHVFSDNNFQPAYFDAFILRDELLCPSHPLSQIFSIRTIDGAKSRHPFNRSTVATAPVSRLTSSRLIVDQ